MANVIDKVAGHVVGPQGPQGPQGPKGDTGQTGPQGATGATGATPNLTMGTVTTLEPDSPATATITGTAENPVLSLGIPKGDTGEVSQAEFDEVADDVSALKEDLNDLAEKTFSLGTAVVPCNQIDGITKRATSSGSVGTSSVSLTNNNNYDTYWYIVDKETTFYPVLAAGQYMDLCVVEGASGNWAVHSTYIEMFGTANTAVRYRTNDGTIPTENNPLTVPAGTLVTFTVSVNTVKDIAFKNVVINTLNNNVRLNTAQISQIESSKIYAQYRTGTGEDDSTEWVDIYVPNGHKYIKFVFVHTVKQSINADVWRIANAYIADSTFSVVSAITTSGEWEMAVKLNGRDDFIGGYAHGDEVMVSDTVPSFFVNGLPVDITTLTILTAIDEVCVDTRTAMYDPSNPATIVGYHACQHKFNKDGLTIGQGILWIGAHTLSNCYMAMLPIAKAVTSKFLTNYKYLATTITGNHTEVKATYARIYGDNVSCEFSVPKYNPKSLYFFLTDNGGGLYNKCYFAIDGTGGVANSDFWETETHYKFDVAQ